LADADALLVTPAELTGLAGVADDRG
jgi:hypothetical protein